MQVEHQASLSNFLASHWVIGGILTSLLWFLAGARSFSNDRLNAAIAWQCVAVFVIVIFCGWAAVKAEWFGFTCGLAVLYVNPVNQAHTGDSK
jgi:hypothetical protein